MRILIVVALGAVACASAHPQPSATPDGEGLSEARVAEERSSRLEQQLSALFAGTAPGDCSRACALVEEICGLSERICSIAGRHGDDAHLAARCAAGRQRCQRARAASAASCTCG